MIPKTYSLKAKEIKRQWHLIDASSAPLGRVASATAKLLIGKHKVSYTPHIDGGDGVIIINSNQLRLTGDKVRQKRYYRHSGYPGSLKELTAEQLIAKDSTRVITLAVRGMLPKNKLQAARLARLRVFKNDQHGMEAQQPHEFAIGSHGLGEVKEPTEPKTANPRPPSKELK